MSPRSVCLHFGFFEQSLTIDFQPNRMCTVLHSVDSNNLKPCKLSTQLEGELARLAVWVCDRPIGSSSCNHMLWTDCRTHLAIERRKMRLAWWAGEFSSIRERERGGEHSRPGRALTGRERCNRFKWFKNKRRPFCTIRKSLSLPVHFPQTTCLSVYLSSFS